MEKLTAAQPGLWRSKYLPPAVIGLTLAIFAGTLLFVNLRLRARLRAQIAGRDAQVLHQIALVQGLADQAADQLGPEFDLGAEDAGGELAVLSQSERLKEVVANLKSILGARLFDSAGKLLLALPPSLGEAEIAAADFASLKQQQPVSHYHAAARREDLFVEARQNAPDQPSAGPVLEVLIPLAATGQRKLIGVTQLLLDGQSIAGEFAALDRALLRQAAGVFLSGGALVVLGLTWAFRRLARANALLAERTASLLKANTELALAAKTSAVGALTAHLIHGLTNPLSGLHSFVTSRTEGQQPEADAEWEEAASTTRRMQNMIQETVRVLREENGIAQYEVTLAELVELIAAKAQPAARAAGVVFETRGAAQGVLSNREANLVMLILENLLTNAIQATPQGKAVCLGLAPTAEGFTFEVCDQGPGLPDAVQPTLFSPGHSAKPGGSGIGLAISKQLASHLGGELALKHSSPQGCVFTLKLPRPRQ
jgi:signal transduction histidine kinase